MRARGPMFHRQDTSARTQAVGREDETGVADITNSLKDCLAESPAPSLQRRVRRRMEQAGAFADVEHALVAVSGGVDSAVLLDVLAAIALTTGPRLTVVHVDHGLRDGSAAEAHHVARLARTRDLPFRGARVTVPRRGDGGVSEAAARAARRDAFRAVAREVGATAVATGHTADDQAETLLLRLGRGTGPRGLAAMSAVDRLEGGLRLVRPLLGERRSDLVGYARARDIPWLEDPSNAEDTWLRNRVRRTLVPSLALLFGEGVVDRLTALAATLGEERAAVTALVDALEGRLWQRDDDARAVVLDVAGLRSLPPAARRHVFVRALDALGVRTGYGRRNLQALAALADSMEGSATLHLPTGLVASRRYGAIRVGPPGPLPPIARDLTMGGPGRYVTGAFTLTVRVVPEAPDKAAGGARDAWFGAESTPFPLRLRCPRPGERVALPGGGHKKVSRLLVDRKVPCDLRPCVRLLVDGGDRPLWVIGPEGGMQAALDPLPMAAVGLLRTAERGVRAGEGSAVHVALSPQALLLSGGDDAPVGRPSGGAALMSRIQVLP